MTIRETEGEGEKRGQVPEVGRGRARSRDQGERTLVNADLPPPPLLQITCSSLCTPARFTGLPPPQRFAPRGRDGLLSSP